MRPLFCGISVLLLVGCSHSAVLNDRHAQLNPTTVKEVLSPSSVAEIQEIVRRAAAAGDSISISGGKHAMGGQQFGENTIHVNLSSMNRVLGLDAEHGIVEVEAGIQWPELIDYLVKAQAGVARAWSIRQKQTGADRLSIGGALSANVHGRGLKLKPFINDVESFTLVDAEGNTRLCSRAENAELFRLAIGGYGLFGIITTVRLRLSPRTKLKRLVEVTTLDQVPRLFEKRTHDGFEFGDFQYSTDENSPDYLKRGVFSTYVPVPIDTPLPPKQKELSQQDWIGLYALGHFDKAQAFKRYSQYYLATSGQVYWSDTHQLSVYVDDYHRALDERSGAKDQGTEMITEVYVPRRDLPRFMEDVRQDFLKNKTNVFYGTVRLVEKDDESFLSWAKTNYACIIFNLHVDHSPAGLEKAQAEFRRLIDRALRYGGSYYLTYHRWATPEQVLKAYPQFIDFLRLKLKYDPKERYQSEWYRYYRKTFQDRLSVSEHVTPTGKKQQ